MSAAAEAVRVDDKNSYKVEKEYDSSQEALVFLLKQFNIARDSANEVFAEVRELLFKKIETITERDEVYGVFDSIYSDVEERDEGFKKYLDGLKQLRVKENKQKTDEWRDADGSTEPHLRQGLMKKVI